MLKLMFSFKFITTLATAIFIAVASLYALNNDDLEINGRYILNENKIFGNNCILIESFRPPNIKGLIADKGCRRGIYNGNIYFSGNVGKNNNIPIVMMMPMDYSYDRSYAYIVGGPGSDYLSNIKVTDTKENNIHSIVKSKKILVLWIGYSGVSERTNLEYNEILTSKAEIENSITELYRKLEDLRIIANSYGAYLYALSSHNLPDIPAYYTYPLLGNKDTFFQYFLKQPEGKAVWEFGYIKKWKYNKNTKEVYGSKEELVLTKDFMQNYFGDHGAKTNYELLDKSKLRNLTILYSSKDERTGPSEISYFRTAINETKIFDLNTINHGCGTNIECYKLAQSIIFDK